MPAAARHASKASLRNRRFVADQGDESGLMRGWLED
jgi:hypothetical protein